MEAHLVKTCVDLAKAMNEVADGKLSGRLAEIVKLHAGLAVGSALIPVPGADVAAATANVWAMYARINKELALPFSENVMKSLAAGMATNLAANAAGVVVGSALKFIPVFGTIGGMAIMGASVYAITITSGIIYMKALTKLLHSKSADRITAEELKRTAEEMSRSGETRTIFNEAKASYKKTG